jgi:membrane-associated protease RseP (regulator of RpoE activity)
MDVETALLLTWAVCVVGVSALLHEFGHAWTARAVGWKIIGLRWRWYGVACVADPNGKPHSLWKVALGGLAATALLALLFLAGTALPDPAPFLFGLGFALNAALLLTNLVPLRALDGGQMLAGFMKSRADVKGMADAPHCPDCDAPLLAAYAESHGHGLQLVLICAADCGYSRKPAGTRPQPN